MASVYAAVLALCAIGAMLTYLPGIAVPEDLRRALRTLFVGCGIVGIVGSTWLINFLLMAKPKR